MQFDDSVKQLISQARSTLVEQLRNLDQHTKKINRQQMCTKLKIIIGLISENGVEELQQEVKQFNDQDLMEVVKTVREKIVNGGANAKVVEPAPVEKPVDKRNDRIKQVPKKVSNPNRSNSIVKGILEKFIKKDENVKQMILPDKQVKHYYDKEKGKYVFEGEEQEQIKQIPKPPPAKKVNQSATNPKTTTKKGQLDQMMAPPAFKRKGMKKKEQTVQKLVQTQCTFETFQQKITNQLEDISVKIMNMFAEQIAEKQNSIAASKPAALPAQALNTLSTLKEFSDQIRSAQQISDTMMTRLYSSYIDSQSGIESLQNILQQIVNYQKTNTKIFHTLLETKQHNSPQHTQITTEQHQQINKKLKSQQEQIQLLKLEIDNNKSSLSLLMKQLSDQREKYRYNLESQVSENKMIKDSIQEKKNDLLVKERQIGELVEELNRKKDEIKHFKSEIGLLRQKLHNFETNLRAEQKQILEILLRKSTQTDLMDEISEAMSAQNDLYFSIQAKRMSLCTQGKQPSINHASDQPDQSSSTSLFELSDSFSKVVQHYQNQLSILKRQHTSISQSYQHIKSESNRTHQNLTAQNQSLQRSITRLKSLIQTYKQQKQQSELKLTQLENDNQSLHRQIGHVRKQHNYTKQILEQNIRASHDNTITLKQQLEEDIKLLEEKLEEKQLNQKLLHEDIKYKNEEIQEYLKQIKNKQIKISNLEKDLKNTKLKLSEQEIQANGYQIKLQQRQQLLLRAKQQRNKLDQTLKNTKNKIKQLTQQNTILKNNEKQYKKQHGNLIRALEESKQENQEIMVLLEQSNRENEEYKQKLTLSEGELKIKQEQINGLLLELKQTEKKAEQNTNNNTKLHQELLLYSEIFAQMKQEITEYKSLFNCQNDQIQLLMQQLYQSKSQLHHLETTMLTKTQSISENLLISNQQTEEIKSIFTNIREYQKLTAAMSGRIQELENKDRASNQFEVQFIEASKKANLYENTINELQDKLAELRNIQLELEQTTKKFADNEVQLYKKQKQLIHLRNQSHKITQLQQQKSLNEQKIQLLEQQRNSFEQITFQMQKQLQIVRQDHQRGIELCTREISQLKDVVVSKGKQCEEAVRKIYEKELLVSELQRKCMEYQGMLANSGQVEQIKKQFETKIEEILEQKNCQILTRDELIKQLQSQISQIEDKQDQYRKLQHLIEEQIKSITDLERQNGDCKEHIAELSHKLKQGRQLLQAKQRQYSEKEKGFEDTVNDLLQQLEQKQIQLKKQSAQHEQNLNKLLKQQAQKQQQTSPSIKTNDKPTDTQSSNGHINGNGLSVKDKLINNIQSTKDEIVKKIQQIQRLSKEVENKQRQLSQANKILNQNKDNIEKLLIELEGREQEVSRLEETIAGLRKQLVQAKKPVPVQPPKNIQHQSKSAEHSNQEQQLQQLILVQDEAINQLTQQSEKLNREIAKLTKQLELSHHTISQLSKQKNQLHDLYIQKSEQADTTIQRLEAEIRDSQKYVVQYEMLQAKFKDLEVQNGELLVEKSELLKTRNEMMAKMTQRIESVPQNQQPKPQRKQNDDKIKQQPIKPQSTKKQQPPNLTTKKQTSTSEPEVQKPGGFFGSLSSLFLTPTQNQKLRQVKK